MPNRDTWQALAGDVTGTSSAAVVTKIHGVAVDTPAGDGDVATFVGADGRVEWKAPAGVVQSVITTDGQQLARAPLQFVLFQFPDDGVDAAMNLKFPDNPQQGDTIVLTGIDWNARGLTVSAGAGTTGFYRNGAGSAGPISVANRTTIFTFHDWTFTAGPTAVHSWNYTLTYGGP